MAKLGYTWYPKDWGNSEHVFELSLSERGLYREIIDLAMLNDNKIEFKKETWIRKFFVQKNELELILDKLLLLKLIEFNENILSVPSCENRLKLVRGGSNGGKKSKPIPKPIPKPFESLCEKNVKPIAKQRERETKIETKIEIKQENNNDRFFLELINSESWIENTSMQSKQRFIPNEIKMFLKKYNDMINVQFEIKINKTQYCTHFINWLNKQEKKNNIKRNPLL